MHAYVTIQTVTLLDTLSQHGFCIGVKGVSQLQAATTNMQSARQNPQVINNYLQKLGNILGTYLPHPFADFYINGFGVIPKKHQSGW